MPGGLGIQRSDTAGLWHEASDLRLEGIGLHLKVPGQWEFPNGISPVAVECRVYEFRAQGYPHLEISIGLHKDSPGR